MVAATLKQSAVGRLIGVLRYFRDRMVAATLKQDPGAPHRQHQPHFRDRMVAATLKQGTEEALFSRQRRFP